MNDAGDAFVLSVADGDQPEVVLFADQGIRCVHEFITNHRSLADGENIKNDQHHSHEGQNGERNHHQLPAFHQNVEKSLGCGDCGRITGSLPTRSSGSGRGEHGSGRGNSGLVTHFCLAYGRYRTKNQQQQRGKNERALKRLDAKLHNWFRDKSIKICQVDPGFADCYPTNPIEPLLLWVI